jgi:hypothetical protein
MIAKVPPHIPASVGELYDKLTILEIKAERIADAGRLRYVTRELALLRAIEKQFASTDARHIQLITELKRANEALWEIEDAIRDCERRGDFGAEFIALARSVYKTNDKRSALKNEISRLHNSEIQEQKSYSPYD